MAKKEKSHTQQLLSKGTCCSWELLHWYFGSESLCPLKCLYDRLLEGGRAVMTGLNMHLELRTGSLVKVCWPICAQRSVLALSVCCSLTVSIFLALLFSNSQPSYFFLIFHSCLFCHLLLFLACSLLWLLISYDMKIEFVTSKFSLNSV